MGQRTTSTPRYDKRKSILSQWQSQSKLHVSAASTASGCFKSGGSFTYCRNPRAPEKRTSPSTQAGFLEEADWLLRSRRCHSLAAASTKVERHVSGVAREYPGGTPTAPTAASPASRDQTGSRVTCRGAWGRRACRPPQQGTRRAGEAVWVGAGRAAARGGGGGGGGPAAPRPRHVVRGGQPSCYKHKQRGAATAGAPAPLPLPPPPPPASRAPPARPPPPTPRDRSPAPPASRDILLFTLGAVFLHFAHCNQDRGKGSCGKHQGVPPLPHSLAGWKELWSLGVNGHRGGTPVQPYSQPVRESLRSHLRPCLPGTARDELPSESIFPWSLEGQVTAKAATSVSLSNSELIWTLWIFPRCEGPSLGTTGQTSI